MTADKPGPLFHDGDLLPTAEELQTLDHVDLALLRIQRHIDSVTLRQPAQFSLTVSVTMVAAAIAFAVAMPTISDPRTRTASGFAIAFLLFGYAGFMWDWRRQSDKAKRLLARREAYQRHRLALEKSPRSGGA